MATAVALVVALAVTLEVGVAVAFLLAVDVGVGDFVAALALPESSENAINVTKNLLNRDPT